MVLLGTAVEELDDIVGVEVVVELGVAVCGGVGGVSVEDVDKDEAVGVVTVEGVTVIVLVVVIETVVVEFVETGEEVGGLETVTLLDVEGVVDFDDDVGG